MPKEPQSIEAQLSNLRRWHRTLTKEVQVLSVDNRKAISRLDRLNGSVDKIHAAADTLDQLQELAAKLERVAQQLNPEVINTVLRLAEQTKENDDWWEGTKRRLQPLRSRPALAIWAIISGVLVWVVGSDIAYILTRR